jgi:hypothetical protein
VAIVLESFDARLLFDHGCFFGGGTAIVLRHGEYRESVDIDFLISSAKGYRALRQLVRGGAGVQALMRAGARIEQTRDVRADQYGLRSRVRVLDTEIKFEIIYEARIALETPSADDQVCGIATLTRLDMAASKLLANSDRWADDAVQSRDLIDLAQMEPPKALLDAAKEKARAAYGESVDRDLVAAFDALRRRPDRLEECMRALQMRIPKSVLWKRIRTVATARRSPGSQ